MKSISNLAIRAINAFVVRVFRVFRKFFRSKIVKALDFDTANPGDLLVANGNSEIFLVHAADKAISRNVYINDGYDFEKLQLVIKLLGTKQRFELLIDIGANIGTICIPAVKRGLFVKAMAFEPEKKNHTLLTANIFLNGLEERISTYNMALGDTINQTVRMQLSSSNYGDHRVNRTESLGRGGDDLNGSVEVRSTTLDNVISDVNPETTLIWIDTQGYEGYILAGAVDILSKHVPLVLEFWPYGMVRSGAFECFKESLINAKYNKFINLDDKEHDPLPLTNDNLDKLYHHVGLEGAYTDILVY